MANFFSSAKDFIMAHKEESIMAAGAVVLVVLLGLVKGLVLAGLGIGAYIVYKKFVKKS